MRRWLVAVRIVAIALVVVLACAFAVRIDGARVGRALAHARLAPIALATVLTFGNLWCKAACWRVILSPRYAVRMRRLYRYAIVAFAASSLAPVRAGEAVRFWLLKRRDGVLVADAAATAVCEKALDGAAMFLLAAPAPWLVPDLPSWVTSTLVIGALVVAGTLVMLAVAARRTPHRAGWLARFRAGMHVLRAPRRAAAVLALLVLAWVIDLAMVELVLYAFHIALSPAAALIVLVAINLAIAVPAMPAQVGIHEAGALAGLSVMHVPMEPAIAFALVYHAIQVIPLVATGLALEWRLVLGRERVTPEPSPSAPAPPS